MNSNVLRVCGYGFFFFQAEDGIRDYKVTGVQTCALPIFASLRASVPGLERTAAAHLGRAGLGDRRHVFQEGLGRAPAPRSHGAPYRLRTPRDRKSVV